MAVVASMITTTRFEFFSLDGISVTDEDIKVSAIYIHIEIT